MKHEEPAEKIDLAITRKEYFAGEALRGILANPNSNISSDMVAEVAMIYAEAMVKEFDKIKTNEENLRRIYGTHP